MQSELEECDQSTHAVVMLVSCMCSFASISQYNFSSYIVINTAVQSITRYGGRYSIRHKPFLE